MRNYLKFVLRDSGIHPDYVAGYLRALRQAWQRAGTGKLELMYLWQGRIPLDQDELLWPLRARMAQSNGLACRVDDARAERSHDCQLNARVRAATHTGARSARRVLAMTFDLTTGLPSGHRR